MTHNMNTTFEFCLKLIDVPYFEVAREFRLVLYKNSSEKTSFFFSRVLQNHEVSGLYRSGENLKFFRRTYGRGNSKLYESKF